MADSRQDGLESLLGHRFERSDWLERALTHSSWMAENAPKDGSAGIDDNEKLEFLGDAVLALVVSEALLTNFPAWREGELSKARATLVNSGALAEAARRLDLGAHLRLGRGEEKTGGRQKTALLADAYEAVVAALFLDAGLPAARTFIEGSLLSWGLAQQTERLGQADRKSHLQELLQAHGWPPATYRVVGQTGPDHRKVFEVEVIVGGRATAFGQGSSKKEAEQIAASGAIEQLARTFALDEKQDAGSGPNDRS